jgi:hypothetical protein
MNHNPARTLRLNELVATSDRSQLIGYSFESKQLRLQIFHPTAGLVHLQIPTDTVHGRTVPTDPRRSACRIDLVDLGKTLSVVEERYSPPTNLDRFPQHAQTRTTLAYGRRASEYGWLLLVRGEYPLLACLVGDLSDIALTAE